MDIEAIRQDTAEIMAGVDGWDPDYITDELIATLDEFEEVEGSATFDDDLIVAAPSRPSRCLIVEHSKHSLTIHHT